MRFVNPNSLHKFFRLGRYDYRHRKERTVDIARRITGAPLDMPEGVRAHDVADSICMAYFFTSEHMPLPQPNHVDVHQWMDTFAYDNARAGDEPARHETGRDPTGGDRSCDPG